jgi:hypothetical protein
MSGVQQKMLLFKELKIYYGENKAIKFAAPRPGQKACV